jgi:hypothetical protein
VLITMDRKTPAIIFTRSDGKEARFPLQHSPFKGTSAIASFHFTPAFTRLLTRTVAGDEIIFELPKQNGDQLNGRLVVYLDQNQWSIIDRLRRDTSFGTEADRELVRMLDEWVRRELIVLPASAGHYYETTKWTDARRRYHLGLTILQLSRGWQMRHPLQVRRDELIAAFRNQLGQPVEMKASEVFTLRPFVTFPTPRRQASYKNPSDFPPDRAFQHAALTSASALIDVMLDAEAIQPRPDIGWAKANQKFSNWLDGETRDAQQKRNAIDVFLLSDLKREIAEVALDVGMHYEQLSHWVHKQAVKDICRLPALGMFREMMHGRHLNKGTVWKFSDLTDMIYLSCAAGYADFVVCERHMGSILAQGVKRLKRPTQVFTQLSKAIPAIQNALQ